jgi:hypothetical protein
MTEAQMNDLIIGVAAKLQQKGFEAGKHDRPWCEEAEEQHRELINFVPFERKNELYEKFCEDLKKLEEEDKTEIKCADCGGRIRDTEDLDTCWTNDCETYWCEYCRESHVEEYIRERDGDEEDETNWNEEGDDELASAIDASGNALW